jgi:hypothetical protein
MLYFFWLLVLLRFERLISTGEQQMGIRSGKLVFLAVSMLVVTLLGTGRPARAESEEETLKRLERKIKEQQAQMDQQQKAIEELKKQMEQGSEPAAPGSSPEAAAPAPEKIVESRGDKVKVILYGQVNRAVLYSHDGENDNWYFVDNDNSSTRIGLIGRASGGEDLSIRTRLEFEYQTNASNEVSQKDKNGVGGDSFNARHLDIILTSVRFGRLYLGKGDTASNNTSEMDISGTAVVGYSSIADMAGGQLFFDRDTDSLSDTDIGDVFDNMDGLGRDDRLRYDTPNFYGFVVSGSVISGDAADVALRFSRENIGGFQVAAALAYSDPAGTDDIVDDQVNGSVSLLHRSGFNFTFAAGMQNYKNSEQDDATFLYGKLGYKREFFSLGATAFSVDYGQNDDVDEKGDEALTFGAQFVQNVEKWGTEYYLGYCFHSLDRKGQDFKDINAVMSGLRVRF